MRYAPLGASGPRISAVGLGAMSWVHCRYGEKAPEGAPVDSPEVREMVGAALDSGITLFDTAEGYGRGHAEALLGEALAKLGKRAEAVIATKVGPLFAEEQTRAGGRPCDLSRAHIRARCEGSLKRLQTDRIDLYLAHHPDPLTPIAETMAAFEELRREGKILHYGVSNFDVPLLEEAVRHGTPVANQLSFNLIDRGIEVGGKAAKLPFCLKHGIGIMAYSPLGKGVLSGKYDEAHLPPADDYRHQRFYFEKDRLPRHFALVRRCRELAKESGITVGQLAMAWCLAQPGVGVVLPGAKTPEQVRENAAAGAVGLPAPVLAELNKPLSG